MYRTVLVPRQHVGQIAQTPGIGFVGLGQLSHRLGEVARLARVDSRHAQLRVLQRTHHPALVATGGFDDHQVHIRRLESRDQLVPSRRLVGHAQALLAKAGIQMLLGHVDPSVRPCAVTPYPTLRMHVCH